MKFKVKDLEFKVEEFQDDIKEYQDILPIIEELSYKLSYEEIECAQKNDCCLKGKKNYLVEIQGYINKNDEFITKEEAMTTINPYEISELDLFVIRIYKCKHCGKWMIDILE